MPLPVILAALARVAGPVLARMGARAAAGAAAEGAIGTAAQQAGRATAARAAGGVLDSTKIGNARGLTAALGGKVPAAAGGPPPIPAPGPVPTPSAPAAPARAPAAPQSARPDSWASKLGKKFADIRAKVADVATKAAQPTIPDVKDQTKGMSWEQRYERLQKAGRLLEPSQVAKSIGTPNPTRDQITEKSEEHEQAANEKFNEAGAKAKSSAKAAAFSLGIGGPIALAVAFKKATDAATAYAEGQVEASRTLARFNSQIANAVARFNLADLRRQGRYANATSTSTQKLIDTFSKFKDEFQPIKQVLTTGLNTMAAVVIQFARLAIGFLKSRPEYIIAQATADAIEANERKKSLGIQGDFRAGVNKFLEAHNKKVGK